jgi:CRP-like cAMP-binding protein
MFSFFEQPHEPDAHDAYCATDDVFRDLTAEEQARIERQIHYANYPAGHLFYSPGEQDDRLLIVRQGRVRLYKLSPEGRALTLFVLGPTAIFGETTLTEQWQHDCFAESMTDCVVGVIGRAQLQEVLRSNSVVVLRFMDVISRRLREMERKLADIAFKSVPQRLATILLNLADCLNDVPEHAPPSVVRYTHQQLAEMIGSYRETVTKAIGEFREDGLIRVDEDTIYLTDLFRLRQLAGR